MSSSIFILSLALLMVTSTLGHSQMRCANYDIKTQTCLAPIRNAGISLLQEAVTLNLANGVCHTPMTNPISASYSNGAACTSAPCPAPMGSVAQGQNITVMWFARNHAIDEQTPGMVSIYISPLESMTQGTDASADDFHAGKFCEAPFMSCNGQNGDQVQCYATCKMPASTAVGIHTLWWKWDWNNHNEAFTTCADLYITAGSGSSSTPSTPSTPSTSAAATPAKPSTTAAPIQVPVVPSTTSPKDMTTGVKAPATSGPRILTTGVKAPVVPSTTGMKAPSTTGVAYVPPTTPSVPATTSSNVCILGSQVCVGSGQYQTCTNGREANYWAAPQTCNVGTTCHPSTNPLSINKIYCY